MQSKIILYSRPTRPARPAVPQTLPTLPAQPTLLYNIFLANVCGFV
jgi:hypothetical protein